MSLRTRLQISIVVLVVVVVLALSALNIHGMIETRFRDTLALSTYQAQQVYGFLVELVQERAAQYEPPPRNLEDIKEVWTQIVERDAELRTLLEQLAGNSRVVVEVLITGQDDRILAASLPGRQGQKIKPPPNFEDFAKQGLWTQFNGLFLGSNQDYEVTEELGIPAEGKPLFTVRVILSTAVLRDDMMPQIENLGWVSGLSMLLSILLAVVVSNLSFRPLNRISDIIDRITRGEFTSASEGSEAQSTEEAAVESKLTLLGERFRGAQADRTELRTNIKQLIDRLEEAVLLFGKDDRLLIAGGGAERLMGEGRWESMGKPLTEVFPAASPLGAVVQSAVHLHRQVRDQPVVVDRDGGEPTRLLVNVEVIEEFPSHERAGTLITLRDADPRRQIASQLDISTRLAAISRLTSGAAHEIKNPLNSISLHLELLRSKLERSAPEAQEEIEVITREITRLDRVVKSFLDFTRPIDLQINEIDLAEVAREVASLVRAEAASRQIEVVVEPEPQEAYVRGDRDLLTQAILNVVGNGIEAMKNGGRLELGIQEKPGEWLLTIRDQGPGIPEELHDKIYNLYFTTKGKGSGIGLAMTYRVVQLHGGTIDFTSKKGTGTEFQLQLPAIENDSVPSAAASPAAPAREKA